MAADRNATAGKSLGSPMNADLAFHVLSRGSKLPSVGRPSPIHNKITSDGDQKPSSTPSSAKITSDSQHHDGSEDFVSPSLTDEKSSLSSSEVMPRNVNPNPHGPSPAGNKKTSLLDFAAPSTLLDGVILEGFSAGTAETLEVAGLKVPSQQKDILAGKRGLSGGRDSSTEIQALLH